MTTAFVRRLGGIGCAFVVSGAWLFGGARPCAAAPLIGESFAGPGYAVGADLVGLDGGSGFDAPWAYQSPPEASPKLAAGLTFSDYPVAGAAVDLRPVYGRPAWARRSVAATSIVATGGELWTSHLFRLEAAPGA